MAAEQDSSSRHELSGDGDTCLCPEQPRLRPQEVTADFGPSHSVGEAISILPTRFCKLVFVGAEVLDHFLGRNLMTTGLLGFGARFRFMVGLHLFFDDVFATLRNTVAN